jgi:hypothetical protein
MPADPSEPAHPASRLLRGAPRPAVDGEVIVLVVPRSDAASTLTAQVVKAVGGERFRSVMVMASARGKYAGRIHVGRLGAVITRASFRRAGTP